MVMRKRTLESKDRTWDSDFPVEVRSHDVRDPRWHCGQQRAVRVRRRMRGRFYDA